LLEIIENEGKKESNWHACVRAQEVVAQGGALNVKMPMLGQAQAALAAALAWARAAATATAPGNARLPYGRRPALAAVEALLEEYEGLHVELEEATPLREKQEAAAAWVARARRRLDAAQSAGPPADAQAPDLEARFAFPSGMLSCPTSPAFISLHPADGLAMRTCMTGSSSQAEDLPACFKVRSMQCNHACVDGRSWWRRA
jgi:hypothetical protein